MTRTTARSPAGRVPPQPGGDAVFRSRDEAGGRLRNDGRVGSVGEVLMSSDSTAGCRRGPGVLAAGSALTRFSYSRRALRWAGSAAVPSRTWRRSGSRRWTASRCAVRTSWAIVAGTAGRRPPLSPFASAARSLSANPVISRSSNSIESAPPPAPEIPGSLDARRACRHSFQVRAPTGLPPGVAAANRVGVHRSFLCVGRERRRRGAAVAEWGRRHGSGSGGQVEGQPIPCSSPRSPRRILPLFPSAAELRIRP